jgi:hypothetical protein
MLNHVKHASSAALTESLPSIIFSVAKLTSRMLFKVAAIQAIVV